MQPLRALGRCGGALTDIADAIRWAAGLDVAGVPANPTPARVISLSLGSSEPCTAHTQSAVDAAIAAGSVVVAATGNESDIALISPANCRGVIAVTAHTINGENADYANIGAATTISAPGGGSPVLLGAGGPTDDANWTGYYIWSTLLYGATDPCELRRARPHAAPPTADSPERAWRRRTSPARRRWSSRCCRRRALSRCAASS